jgi:hypothetical protein
MKPNPPSELLLVLQRSSATKSTRPSAASSTHLRDNFLQIIKSVLCVVLVASSLGCEHLLTQKLWQNENLTAFSEAASSARVEVRADPAKDDYLIAYDETLENHSQVNRRAYWLHDNLDRISNGKKPRFVGKETVERMARVDPLHLRNSSNEINYLVMLAPDTFVIHDRDKEDGPHTLPVYRCRSGLAAKMVLTPVAAMADLTVIGVAAGAATAVGMAAGGACIPSR